VEILMTILCFLFAIIPIMSLYSYSIENLKLFHAKSQVYSAAQEIFRQAYLLPHAQIPDGSYLFSPTTETQELFTTPAMATIHLCQVASSVARGLELFHPEGKTDPTSIRMFVQSANFPRASLEWDWQAHEMQAGRE
jgi:hypothetical protein